MMMMMGGRLASRTGFGVVPTLRGFFISCKRRIEETTKEAGP